MTVTDRGSRRAQGGQGWLGWGLGLGLGLGLGFMVGLGLGLGSRLAYVTDL